MVKNKLFLLRFLKIPNIMLNKYFFFGLAHLINKNGLVLSLIFIAYNYLIKFSIINQFLVQI